MESCALTVCGEPYRLDEKNRGCVMTDKERDPEKIIDPYACAAHSTR
jgi:hypothetical protein